VIVETTSQLCLRRVTSRARRTMTTIQTVLIVGGLAHALLGNSALAQNASATRSTLAPGNAVTTNPLPLSSQNKNQGDKPYNDKPSSDKPGKHGNHAYPDQVKQLLDDIKNARSKFLQDQKNLQNKLKDANEAARDQIRNEMQDKRDQFLEQQKDMREEVIKRVAELKDQLKNHQDLIDSAKDRAGVGASATSSSSPRKGGGN
jgi:hypothetical protein